MNIINKFPANLRKLILLTLRRVFKNNKSWIELFRSNLSYIGRFRISIDNKYFLMESFGDSIENNIFLEWY
jgi:hypothetical protein